MALVSGLLLFAGFVLLLNPEKDVDPGAQLNTMMAAGAAVLALFASVLVPKIQRDKMRQGIIEGKSWGPHPPAAVAKDLGDVGSLTSVYQTTLIVGAALLEGAAFYNLFAYLLERQTISVVCTAILIVAMLLKFPTRNAVQNWVEEELKRVAEIRSLER